MDILRDGKNWLPMLKSSIKKLHILFFASFLLSACQLRTQISQARFISRHYTMQQGHASLSEDDYGQTDYIISKSEGQLKYQKFADFDSFYYFPDENSPTPIQHIGFKEYINIDSGQTFFDFHYNGECNYQIKMKNGYTYTNSGKYSLNNDDVTITFETNEKSEGVLRFGLTSDGLAKDKIVYFRIPLKLNIDDVDTMVYLWFYDGILHPSPWGEE